MSLVVSTTGRSTVTELGYDWSDAQKMVCLDIDWHELKDLLERDCNPRLAVDILA